MCLETSLDDPCSCGHSRPRPRSRRAPDRRAAHARRSSESHTRGRVVTPAGLSHRRAIIVGAGQSGLAVAAALIGQGLRPQQDFVMIDAAPAGQRSWSSRWHSLTLLSDAGHSALPHHRIPGDPARHLRGDEIADYLDDVQRQLGRVSHTSGDARTAPARFPLAGWSACARSPTTEARGHCTPCMGRASLAISGRSGHRRGCSNEEVWGRE